MKSEKRKKLVSAVVLFAAANLAYSLFSLYTLMSFGMMTFGCFLYIKINIDDIKRKGLISYLPARHQKMLLQRSLFDILCDMWFIPKVSVYIKAVVTPFFLKIDPSDAVNQFKDLPPVSRKAIFTKGVVNVLPGFVKATILPKNELVTEDSSDYSSNAEEQGIKPNKEYIISQSPHYKHQESPAAEILFNDTASNISNSAILDSLRLDKIDRGLSQNRLTQASTDEEGLVNHNFNQKSVINHQNVDPISLHLDFQNGPQNNKTLRLRSKISTNKSQPKLEKEFLVDSEKDLRSQVLSSSKMLNRKSNKVEVSETWDKMELFARKHREKLLKQRMNRNAAVKKFELKGPLQMLQNIAMLMSKEALMNKLEDKKLMKLFLMSTFALLLQFSISKKTRMWCYNTLNILMYITGFTLSTGSMTILAIKMKTKYAKWKEQQKLENTEEIARREEEEMRQLEACN